MTAALKNTEDRYGLVAQGLHWAIALLFLGCYASVYYRHWFTTVETPKNLWALDVHLAFGITIAAFVVLRLIWKFVNRGRPRSLTGGRQVENLAARAAHIFLYFAMIVMPVTGYLGTERDSNLFGLLPVPQFGNTDLFATTSVLTGVTWSELERVVDGIHVFIGGSLLWVLIGIHAAAALYHHFIRRDAVLSRMVPGLAARSPRHLPPPRFRHWRKMIAEKDHE